MGSAALLSLLAMTIISICSAVACVVVLLKRGSASTRRPKPQASPEQTPSSEVQLALASVQVDQAALFSELEKITTTVKRLSSRQGMRDSRERERAQSSEAPPTGTPKAELLRYYGMSGKVGPAFAQAQLELERKH